MKKLLVLLVVLGVTVLTQAETENYPIRGQQEYYGYRGYKSAIGLTVLPWSLPNEESSVVGLRFNLGWGGFRSMNGIDLGLSSVSDSASGLQINLFNYVKDEAKGLQIGLVNIAGGLTGCQIGLLNYAERQQFFPIINFGF